MAYSPPAEKSETRAGHPSDASPVRCSEAKALARAFRSTDPGRHADSERRAQDQVREPRMRPIHLAVETGNATRLSSAAVMTERPRPTADRTGPVPDGTAMGCDGGATDLLPRLLLTGIAPGRLCALWSVPAAAWRRALARAPRGRAALRLYRVDASDRNPPGTVLFIDGPGALRTLDVREGVFVAEVGVLRPDGRMDRLAASDPATVPAAEESPDISLAIVDVRHPPQEGPPTPLPAARFLRLFALGRHPQPSVRRGPARPAGSVPAVGQYPEPGPVVPQAPSGGHETDAESGWPLACRRRRTGAEDAA